MGPRLVRVRNCLLFALLAASLAGCARETVIVERGGRVSDISRPVIAGSRSVLQAVEQTSLDASIELAVADQSCEWPTIRLNNSLSPRPLCVPASQPHTTVSIIDQQQLLPTLRQIDALAAYVSEVDRVLAMDPDSSATDLEMALVDVQNLTDIAAGLTGNDSVTLLKQEQQAAAVSLVALIGDLARTRAQAQQLILIEKQNPEVGKVIDLLDKHLGIWTDFALVPNLDNIDAALTIRNTHMRTALAEAQKKDPSARIPDAELRAFLTAWADAKGKRAAAEGLPVELKKALAALRTAHADYVRIIQNDKLTDADRADLARAARANLSRALAAVAGVIRSFL